MKTESLVSIIVPIYNVEKYLCCCLDSIIGQSYDNLEILLIDDGSTDRSGQIADTYAAKDRRIQVFHTDNRGVSRARNLGLDKMTGRYCLLVDSDDALQKDAISYSVKLLEKENLDCVIYKYQTVEDDGFEKYIQTIDSQEPANKYIPYSHDELMREILVGQRFRMLACNKLYKTDLWADIRYPIGRKFGDDTFVTYQLMDKCTHGGYIENVLYFYRMREGSALHCQVSAENLQLFLSYSELLEYYQEHIPEFLDEAYYAYLIRMFDFFATVNKSYISDSEKMELLKGLHKISFPFRRKLFFCTKATWKQGIMLCVFFTSVYTFTQLIKRF